MGGQENIRTVHEPKPIQTAATPCGQGRRAMGDFHSPQARILEGANAIKVSMKIYDVDTWFIYLSNPRTDHGAIT